MIECYQVKEYNRRALMRWHEACEKRELNQTLPFVGLYVFYNNRGNERQTGYVARIGGSSFWAKTKSAALAKAELLV